MNPLASLRGRLLLAGLLGTVLAATVGAWWLGAAFERTALAAMDRRLADDLAYVAGAVARDGDGSVRMRREPSDQRYATVFSGYYWQVGEGEAAFRSRSLWDHAPVPSSAPADGRLHAGAMPGPRGQWLRTAEQRIRLPGSDAPVRVWVASDQSLLRQEVADFRWLVGGAAATLAAVLLLVAALQVRYGLQPLRGIADLLARLRSGEGARLDPVRLPTEVRPLAEHLNQLLDHHDRMVQRARDSAQDLAHSLKTPLAVLAAEADRPRPELAASVHEQVARMRAVIDRHLAVGTPAPVQGATPVADSVDRLVAFLHAAFRDRALAIVPTVAPGLEFRGAAEDLEEMLGNLLDNACKWARARVAIAAGRQGDRLWIEVRDDGPGLPPDQHAAALQRGVRLDQRVPGSGLGLAIVADIAASYGGRVSLADAPGGGLLARLDLPAN